MSLKTGCTFERNTIVVGAFVSVQHDISGCFEKSVGETGLSDQVYQRWFDKTTGHAQALAQAYHNNEHALLRIAEKRDDILLAEQHFDCLIEGAETVVFLGTGGSSLGGQTIAQIGGWFIPGHDINGVSDLPRTRIFDNLDPRSLARGLELLDFETTRFVVISKSGNTAETLLQTITVINRFKELGLADRIGRSILGLSEVRRAGVPNGLRDLLDGFGCAFLDHELEIGGRYSCLTNVGLLLAIARGMDPMRIRQGASDVVTELIGGSQYDEFMPVVGAAASVGLYQEKNISNVVMMPYANQLARFSHWYVQLWAESLGKEGLGMTPISALGPVDQHSLLQLFMDGPKDKLITIVASASTGEGPFIDKEMALLAGIDYMADRHVGDLVSAQARATLDALRSAGQPTRYIWLPEIEEYFLGQMLMSFMVETILAAQLLGVNAYDQPAVEIGKGIARGFLRDPEPSFSV